MRKVTADRPDLHWREGPNPPPPRKNSRSRISNEVKVEAWHENPLSKMAAHLPPQFFALSVQFTTPPVAYLFRRRACRYPPRRQCPPIFFALDAGLDRAARR